MIVLCGNLTIPYCGRFFHCFYLEERKNCATALAGHRAAILFNRDLRRIVTMIELNTFKKLLKENEECLPLLTLDEFFNGNTEEDSIAPNQWEFGRPTLSEIWDMLQKIELMPNIAWVRVALHDDTEIVENNGAEELALAGDTIVVCTTILPTELEKLVNCEWLCSDGVITIEASELNTYSCVPPIPENYNCLEIVWD